MMERIALTACLRYNHCKYVCGSIPINPKIEIRKFVYWAIDMFYHVLYFQDFEENKLNNNKKKYAFQILSYFLLTLKYWCLDAVSIGP